MPVPEYDQETARHAREWAEVEGAPDVLSDTPTRCIFCGEFIAITESDPLLVVATRWQNDQGWLYAAHEACLHEYGERSGTR